MKTKKAIPDFKAVEFMRQRRDELSELYNKHPDEFWELLATVRKKYKSKFRQKSNRSVA